MYQDVLDALNASKTVAQHEKALHDLYSRATDATLKQYILDVVVLVQSINKAISAKANNKNLTQTQRKTAAAEAKDDKAKQFILANSQVECVKKLIDYCLSNI